MKRTLAILGLLVCTTGVAFADEVAVAEMAAPQQVEIQSQLDRQTLDNKYKRGPQFDSEYKNVKDKIKYDKTVKNQKFNPRKDGLKPGFDNKAGIKNYRESRPDIRNDRFNPNFNARRQDFRGHRPAPYMGHHKNPHRRYMSHKPQTRSIKSYKARNHKFDNRRAFNKSVRTR